MNLKEKIREILRTRLYTNAMYLVSIRALDAILGFVFYIIVTRLYAPGDIGIAYAIISAVGLLGSFAHLGLGTGLIRFMSTDSNPVAMVNTALTIGLVTSLAAGLIFIAGIGFWSPALLFLRQNSLYFGGFLALAIVGNLTYLNDQTFIAARQPGYATIKSLIFNFFRVLLPFPLSLWMHSLGIILSWSIALSVSFVIGLFLLMRRVESNYIPQFQINKPALNKIFRFSFLTFSAYLCWGLPNWILPIMVLNTLGAELNAYFAVAWIIGTIIGSVPSAVSTSLLAEGSFKKDELGLNTRRSLKVTYLVLVPAVVIVFFLAGPLLGLFGKGGVYAENATTLIRIIAVTNLAMTVNAMYISVKMVEMKLKKVLLLAVWVAGVTLGLAFYMLRRIGIDGAGYSWLIAQASAAIPIAISLLKSSRRPTGQSPTSVT